MALCLDNKQSESQQNKISQSNQDVSEKPSVSEDKKSADEEDLFDNAVIVHALVDIVSLLWSLHGQQIADPSHEEDHTNLLNIAVACIPLFLKHYKVSILCIHNQN